MNDKTKKELMIMMGDVVQDAIVPVIDDLEEKINNKFEKVESRLDRMENKLDRVIDDHIVTKNKVSDHDKRIKGLESDRIAA